MKFSTTFYSVRILTKSQIRFTSIVMEGWCALQTSSEFDAEDPQCRKFLRIHSGT